MSTIVDIEIAIKLLEVGFPQPQQGYKGATCRHPWGMLISQPTVQEVIEYFKKRDGIYIEAVRIKDKFCWRYYSIDPKTDKRSFVVGCKSKNGYKTEDEALVKGIKHVFKESKE